MIELLLIRSERSVQSDVADKQGTRDQGMLHIYFKFR